MWDWGSTCQEALTGWLAAPGIRIAAAGLLGGLVNAALDAKPLTLPRVRRGRLELGAVGPLISSVAAAYFVDHGFHTAFLGALCGVSAVRHIRSRVRAAFEAEIQSVGRAGDEDDVRG
jgi:hypothetical protein